MTLIAACVGPDAAYMLGDACVTADGLRLVSATPKVARVGPWLVGAAGDAGACTVLLARPLPTDVAALHQRLRKVAGEWSAMLARPGCLMVADSDGDLELVSAPAWAIGSGAEVALGALAAIRRRSPEAMLRAVAGITSRLRCDVCGPMSIVVARA